MTVRTQQSETNVTYFVTFTCCKWLHLFEITGIYDDVYKWFDILKSDGNHILGYVLMPNHMHFLLYLRQENKPINEVINVGKKFRAHEIIKRLNTLGRNDILKILVGSLNTSERKKGSLHKVFETSFDCKACYSSEFIQQKLEYMHDNPISGRWNLCTLQEEYLHSSAKFYLTGDQGIYPVSHYTEFYDIPIARHGW